MKGLPVTHDELVTLIEESDHTKVVFMSYGNNILYGPDWALWRVAEMRGVADQIKGKLR